MHAKSVSFLGMLGNVGSSVIRLGLDVVSREADENRRRDCLATLCDQPLRRTWVWEGDVARDLPPLLQFVTPDFIPDSPGSRLYNVRRETRVPFFSERRSAPLALQGRKTPSTRSSGTLPPSLRDEKKRRDRRELQNNGCGRLGTEESRCAK